jgi:hypothetical protein
VNWAGPPARSSAIHSTVVALPAGMRDVPTSASVGVSCSSCVLPVWTGLSQFPAGHRMTPQIEVPASVPAELDLEATSEDAV